MEKYEPHKNFHQNIISGKLVLLMRLKDVMR